MPKVQHNAFYYFMRELMPQLRAEGHNIRSIADCVPHAHPRFQRLSPEQKAVYEQIAKDERAAGSNNTNKSKKPNKGRLDCSGNVIETRVDEKEEDARRRGMDRLLATRAWPQSMEDMKRVKFLFIAFEYMCKTEEGDYLPMEVGITEYTMQDGITRTFQKFINPGPIPLGCRAACVARSAETHQIPIEKFDKADDNYFSIWTQLLNFVFPQGQTVAETPILYCSSRHRPCVTYCLNWLCDRAVSGQRNRLTRVYDLEDMVVDLYAKAGQPVAEFSVVESVITTTAFDFEKNTKCAWHEDKETMHCALAYTKRYAFALSDSLQLVYHFELTPAHMPVRPQMPAAKATAPFTVKVGFGPSSSSGRGQRYHQNQPQRGAHENGRGDNGGQQNQRGGAWSNKPQQQQGGAWSNGQQQGGAWSNGQQQGGAWSNGQQQQQGGGRSNVEPQRQQQQQSGGAWNNGAQQPRDYRNNDNGEDEDEGWQQVSRSSSSRGIINSNSAPSGFAGNQQQQQQKAIGRGGFNSGAQASQSVGNNMAAAGSRAGAYGQGGTAQFGSRDIRYQNNVSDDEDDDDDDYEFRSGATVGSEDVQCRLPNTEGVCERIMKTSLDQYEVNSTSERFAQPSRMSAAPQPSSVPAPRFAGVGRGRGMPLDS